MRRLLANRWTWIVTVVVAGLVAVAIVYWPKPPPKKSEPLQARIELAAGEVEVARGDQVERAVSGMALRSGTEVKVAASARALVRLPDGSGAFLRGGSALVVKEGGAQLEDGEYWLDASGARRTPFEHHVAGVRVAAADSGLSLKKTDDGASVYVARGRVTVTSDGGRAEVNAGEQATVKGAEAPVVSPVAFWEDWTGGMADAAPNTQDGAGRGTILGVAVSAPSGTPALPLDVQRQSVEVVIRDGLSETKVEQTFFNPTEHDVEGWYWFTIPSDASVTGFSLETAGVLVDGEFVEKREAAQKYTTAKSTGHSPAILEQIDRRTYRARIYPIQALKTRKVVLRYIQLQPESSGKVSYVYPMSSGEPVKIGEFSLKLDLGETGKKMRLSTLADARIENGGEFVTMRRSGFTPRVDFQLEAFRTEEEEPLRVARFQTSDDSADYVLARYAPDLDWDEGHDATADVVVVVDTSAAGDDAARALKVQTAEAILRSLSDADRFALIALDVQPVVLHPEQELAAASPENVSAALDRLAEHPSGGATDLSALFDVGLARLHKSAKPALVYVGDGVATSGELTPEQLLERLKRALATSSARLFTVGVGNQSDFGLLAELARTGGGRSFRVDEASETTVRALQLSSAVKLPTITDLSIDLGAGLDQVFISGGARVAKGSEVSVLARTHHPIPDQVVVRGKLAGKDFEKRYSATKDDSIVASFVPRLWANEYVRSILGSAEDPDRERGRIAALGVRYGLVTPYSSILALESEQAYRRMGIERGGSALRGVRLTALTREEEEHIKAELFAPFAPRTMTGCDADRGGSASTKAVKEAPMSEQPTPAQAAEELELAADGELHADSPEAVAVAPANEAQKADVDEPPPPAPPAPRPRRAMRKAKPSSGGKRLTGSTDLLGGAQDPYEGEDDKAGLGTLSEPDEEETKPQPPSPAPAASSNGRTEFGQRGGSRGMLIAVSTCSDVAARPLWQRTLLWRKRLATATSGEELIERYENAGRACELSDWRAERAFLQLMVPHLSSVGHIRTVLGFFDGRGDVQRYLGKLILRRTVDPTAIAAVEAVLFRSPINWNQVEIQLSELEDVGERIDALRATIARTPDDPNGSLRLIDLLVRAERITEAVEVGRRVRERGFLTPDTARRLGDLLAGAGQREAAERAYSEIVEFDPESGASRRLLGDVYLSHGWYDAAYRQYQTLTGIATDDALAWLRLASSAAGAGRVDEALRIERQVMNAQGTPGPDDPRRWARLHSAAKLARLWNSKETQADATKAAVERKLKELQLFTTPGALVVMTWEDLKQRLSLDAGPEQTHDVVDAFQVGLYSRLLPVAKHDGAELAAQLQTEPTSRALKVWRHDLVWDGNQFQIQVAEYTLPRLQQRIKL